MGYLTRAALLVTCVVINVTICANLLGWVFGVPAGLAFAGMVITGICGLCIFGVSTIIGEELEQSEKEKEYQKQRRRYS